MCHIELICKHPEVDEVRNLPACLRLEIFHLSSPSHLLAEALFSLYRGIGQSIGKCLGGIIQSVSLRLPFDELAVERTIKNRRSMTSILLMNEKFHDIRHIPDDKGNKCYRIANYGNELVRELAV